MYKKAIRQKLRFPTTVGQLDIEQLWDLSEKQLSSAIKAVKKKIKKDDDDELSFLKEHDTVDTENELRFNILKDVYLTKKQEVEEEKKSANIEAHNQKIDALIAEKREGQLRDMSIEELENLRK